MFKKCDFGLRTEGEVLYGLTLPVDRLDGNLLLRGISGSFHRGISVVFELLGR